MTSAARPDPADRFADESGSTGGIGATGHATTGATDGRVARGAANRAAVVDAMLALLLDGVLRPSASEVAARAGVSERSVFRHFQDMESLYAEAADVSWRTRIVPSYRRVDRSAPLDARIDGIVAAHAELFEVMAPIRRGADLVASESAVVREHRDAGRAFLRSEIGSLFRTELQRRRAGTPRDTLLDALEVATSYEAWDQLRDRQGHGIARARRAVDLTLRSLLAADLAADLASDTAP